MSGVDLQRSAAMLREPSAAGGCELRQLRNSANTYDRGARGRRRQGARALSGVSACIARLTDVRFAAAILFRSSQTEARVVAFGQRRSLDLSPLARLA